MRPRLKAFLANALVFVASVVVCYLIGEVVFFRVMAPRLSLNLRPYLPDRADFFHQNSKSSYIPRDYIAIVGDSYAHGIGDWLLATGGKLDRPYHSANVLHEALGRDVVTFSRVAIGSAEAMVQRTTRILGDTSCYLFPPIEPPKRFVVYFYEGNDIDDNFKLLINRVRPSGTDIRQDIDRYLDDSLGRMSVWPCHGHFGDTIFRMVRYLVLYSWRPATIDRANTESRAIVAGASIALPALQVPSLGLDEAAIDAGVVVYERALAWLRRRYPGIPVTVVYIPSPASVYRYTVSELVSADVFFPKDDPVESIEFRPVPASAVYPNSQKICEKIRAVTLVADVGFIEVRRAFRLAAAQAPIHGPRDWNHLNERGHRLLGALIAPRIEERPADACDDRWEAEGPDTVAEPVRR